jgi:hypothetical protein
MSFPPIPAQCSDFKLTASYSTVQKEEALSSKTLENFYHYTCRRSPEEFNSSFSPPRDPKIPIGYVFLFSRKFIC